MFTFRLLKSLKSFLSTMVFINCCNSKRTTIRASWKKYIIILIPLSKIKLSFKANFIKNVKVDIDHYDELLITIALKLCLKKIILFEVHIHSQVLID